MVELEVLAVLLVQKRRGISWEKKELTYVAHVELGMFFGNILVYLRLAVLLSRKKVGTNPFPSGSIIFSSLLLDTELGTI